MVKLLTILVLLNIATLGVCKGVTYWWCTYKDKFLNTYTSGNSTYRDWDTAAKSMFAKIRLLRSHEKKESRALHSEKRLEIKKELFG